MRVTLVSFAVVSLLMVPVASAHGQQLTFEEKDPGIALGFAWLCPGCGHLYSGETTKGALIAGISVGAVVGGLAVQFSQFADNADLECRTGLGRFDCQEPNTSLTPILVGGAIGLVGYVYGLIDAGPSARRMNAKNGFNVEGMEVNASVTRDGSVGARFSVPIAPVW